MRISQTDRRKLNRVPSVAAGTCRAAMGQKSKATLFAVLLFCLLFAFPGFALQSKTVDIPVSVSGGGTVIVTPAVNCPAPRNSVLTIGAGEKGHVLITFSEPGMYSYTVAPQNNAQLHPGSYHVNITVTLGPADHYLTQSQYNALIAALEPAWGPTVSVTPTYTGDKITGYTFTVGTEGNENLFADGTVNEITWQYQTTGDMGNNVTQTFVNTFSDGSKTLPVNNTISPNVRKLNARKINDWQTIFTEAPTTFAFDNEDEDKSFVWVAEVTPVPGVMQYRVTDILPEGVELLGVKVFHSPLTAYNYAMDDNTSYNLTIENGVISGEIGQLWLSKTIASGTVTTTADGRQAVDITLTRNSPSADFLDSQFNVIYYCQFAEDAWPQNGMVHLKLDNTVNVQADDVDYGEAENTIIIDATRMEHVITKVGNWDKNTHLITYTVDINPSAENLLTSSEGVLDPQWLKFTDVLSYTASQGTGFGEAILNLNSVILEKEENGVWTALPEIQWTARTENDSDISNQKNAIIEMKVPDSTHLRLTYSYHINSSMPDGIMLENSAVLEGHGEEPGQEETHIELEDFQTSGESTFEEFCLVKIDQEDGRPLANAVFTVFAWDAENEEWSETAKTYTTDQDGKIIIRLTDEYTDGSRISKKKHCGAER